MTTTESQPAPAAYSYESQAESPSSRFTAVNGRDLPTGSVASSSANGQLHRRDSGEERARGQPRISPPGQEKLTITTTTQPESWSNPPVTERQGPYSLANAPDSDSSHKRKRSNSLDRTPGQGSSASSYHSHPLPPGKSHLDSGIGESPEAREASIRTPSQHTARDPYMSNSQTQYPHYSNESREHGSSAHWYSQNSQDTRTPGDTQHSAISQRDPDEQQLREALQREAAQGLDSQGVYTSPGDDDDRRMSYDGYGGDRTASQIQHDHKKRKRNFSNRTKTGCMTCRRRKKKCDESRPECKFLLLISMSYMD
jgi:hypothetical protein